MGGSYGGISSLGATVLAGANMASLVDAFGVLDE
jgi:hypothetical protein